MSEEMGDGAYEAMLAEIMQDARVLPVMRVGSLSESFGYWRTRDGRVLEIAKMSTLHIDNAIRYFVRAKWGKHEKIDELRTELARRNK